MEAESIGSEMIGAAQIVKKFLVLKCGHHQSPIAGDACLKSMVILSLFMNKHSNFNRNHFFQTKQNNFIVATQDRGLQEWLRSKPGKPLMYLHQKTPVLEQPSEASKKRSNKKIDKSISLDEREEKKLNKVKVEAGLPVAVVGETMRKKFKKKQPNPLCCLKKKKKKAIQVEKTKGVNEESKAISKKPKKRKRIAKHVKEHFKNLQNTESAALRAT